MTQGSGERVSGPDGQAGAVGMRRRELEERVYGGGGATAAEVSELRQLVVVGAAGGAETVSAPDAEGLSASGSGSAEASGSDAGAVTLGRRGSRSGHIAAGVAVLMVAGVVGAGVGGLIGRGGSEHPAIVSDSALSVGDQPSFGAGLSDPPANSEAPVNLDTATASLFRAPQTPADKLPAVFPGIVASSSRQVAAVSMSSAETVPFWVARGDDQSFCLVVAVSRTVGGSSCTPEEQAATLGVSVTVLRPGGGSYRVDWDVPTGTISTETSPTAP